MKFLKYLLILLAVLVVGFMVYIFTIPKNYDVSRSRTIAVSPALAFTNVNEIKTWEEWGPWHDEDSTIVVTYGDKTSGEGAYYSWVGKDSPGNMTTVKVVANELIEQKMQFEDFEPSDVIWKFKETENGTEVTWQMKETNAPFVFRLFSAISGGWQNMLGPMQEQGLKNLEDYLLEQKALAESFRLSDVTPQEFKVKKFIGFPVRMKINHEEMTAAFMKHMPKAGMYAASKGLTYDDYMPAAVYTKYDEDTQETEFYIGLLLNTDLAPGENMEALQLPEGKGVMISKFGNYGNGDEDAHYKIADYLEANNLEQRWPMWETYPNDPTIVKPQDIQTDIYYAVK